MKANVEYGNYTIVGVEGKSISEILNKACHKLGLNEKGRSKLNYKIIKK